MCYSLLDQAQAMIWTVTNNLTFSFLIFASLAWLLVPLNQLITTRSEAEVALLINANLHKTMRPNWNENEPHAQERWVKANEDYKHCAAKLNACKNSSLCQLWATLNRWNIADAIANLIGLANSMGNEAAGYEQATRSSLKF